MSTMSSFLFVLTKNYIKKLMGAVQREQHPLYANEILFNLTIINFII